jgi:hypothetical protein
MTSKIRQALQARVDEGHKKGCCIKFSSAHPTATRIHEHMCDCKYWLYVDAMAELDRMEVENESLKQTIRSARTSVMYYREDTSPATHAKRHLENAIVAFDGKLP